MQTSKKVNWKMIIRWVGTFLSLLLLVELVINTGSKDFLDSIRTLSSGSILSIILLLIISRLAIFARWHVLLQIENMHVSWRDSLRLTFAGLFAANFLPSTIGGDVVRLAGAIRIGIRAPLAAASLIIDRLIGMTGMALMLPFSITPLITLLQSGPPLPQESLAISAVTSFLKKLWVRIRNGLIKIVEAIRFWYKHPQILFFSLMFTFIHMVATFFIIHILVVSMGDSINFWKIAGLWSLIYFISLVPISINGLGLQELTITTIFPMFSDVSHATSLAVALILRGLWIIGSLPGAFFVSGIISGETFSEVTKERSDTKE